MFHDPRFRPSRRMMLALSSGAFLAGSSRLAAAAPVDSGTVTDGRVRFPPIVKDSEAAPNSDKATLPPDQRVGFAVVALGRLSVEEILPAFAATRRCRLTALCSGSPDKLRHVGARYGVAADALYNYDNFDRIAQNPAVQVVYIVLPNSMHKDWVLRAAAAHKHVLCEKPMATSSADARVVIMACADAAVKLMIAYRCRYQPHHREVVERVQSGEFGPAKILEAVNAQNQSDPDQWRLKKALAGGGSLQDIGLYCLNAARATLGEEPVEIEAQIHSPANDPRFAEVEETVAWLMRFPSGAIANLSTSYGTHRASRMAVHLDRGSLVLDSAFPYRGQRLRVVKSENRIETKTELQIADQDRFAAEMDHMAQCVQDNTTPRTTGEEGLRDHLIMEAIYRSAETRVPIRLPG